MIHPFKISNVSCHRHRRLLQITLYPASVTRSRKLNRAQILTFLSRLGVVCTVHMNIDLKECGINFAKSRVMLGKQEPGPWYIVHSFPAPETGEILVKALDPLLVTAQKIRNTILKRYFHPTCNSLTFNLCYHPMLFLFSDIQLAQRSHPLPPNQTPQSDP